MRLARANAAFAAYRSLTDEELVRMVRSLFPNISGVLAEVIRRFDDKMDDDVVYETKEEIYSRDFVCPNCGSELVMEEE